MAGGTVTATWTNSYSRTPTAYVAGPPPLSPLATAVSNTAGQWLFAVVSWRQDAGTAGTLQYPSTVTVSDDAQNFWIPVQAVPASTGILRTAVWMAPAARAAGFVFVSPTAYQSALTVLIAEVTADVPWYSVAAVASVSTNQGTSVTLSQDPASGLFTIGALAYDNASATVTATATGWTATTTVSCTNGTDHSGDLEQLAWTASSTGSTMTISGSSATTMDWSEVIITVHGVTDVIAFPYTVPQIENWPVLLTEIASGPVINADPVMLQGTKYWSGQNAAVAPATWPVYQPWPNYQALITPSISVTPSGSAASGNAQSEQQPVSPVVQYNVLAFAYSVAGYAAGTVGVFINWFTSGSSYISTSNGPSVPFLPGTWTQLSLTEPVFPPPTAAFATVGVSENANTGNVSAAAVFYVGYAGFGPADAYEDVPADQIAWTDLSSRNFTQDSIKISRGIQYEQQALEAGTMTVNLANNDGAMMFGNILSSYWPTIGDTDVPIRLRAVWQQSVTPYYVLFSGFTDQIQFGWDTEDDTWYGYAAVEASDAWSRLTSQLLAAAEEEILFDDPGGFWPCSQSGTNIAPDALTPVSAAVSLVSSGGAVSGFTSSVITLAGSSGLSCWQSTGVPAAVGFQGVALTWFPPAGQPLPPVSGGLTVAFWMSPQSASAAQSVTDLTLCTCWTGTGPMWTITINNNTGAASSTASITVYDKATGAGTTTSIGANLYLGTVTATQAWHFAVTFTQTSLTVVAQPGGTAQNSVTVSANMAATAIGLSWGGNAGSLYADNLGGSPGFMNVAIALAAWFPGIVPAARLAAQHQTAATAWNNERDTSRLARVAGYAGATPAVLAMRGLDLAVWPAADIDPVTPITDTAGQVVSGYFTNIASSTLAAMFVNGAGVLQYRRRLEWYDRPSPQWVLGEAAQYPLNANQLTTSSLAGWAGGNGAVLATGSLANSATAGPYILRAGVFHGDGSTAGASLTFGSLSATPVTAGQWYSLSALFYSPQGWTTGVTLTLSFFTSGGSPLSSVTTTATPLGTGSLLYVTTGSVQAPATAAYMTGGPAVSGTPATSVLVYVTEVMFALAGVVAAGGAGATAPEVPYLSSAKLSSDRALLFNQAILTQYGTGTVTNNKGSSIVFAPTSGVTVLIQNQASIAVRAGVPYTATIYLNNTVQALPYVLAEPSMEDFGNWIVQTLASPLLRPETVTITPAVTEQAMLMALGAEVGDTTTFRRRPQTGGAPEIQDLTYLSKLTHTIKQDSQPPWVTEVELSPFPVGTVLACDDVIHGTLTGGNQFGW